MTSIVPVALQFNEVDVEEIAVQFTSTNATTPPTTTATTTESARTASIENTPTHIDNNPPTAATAHDQDWYEDVQVALQPINGPVYTRKWAVKLATGVNWTHGCNHKKEISRLDVFLQMFPPEQLKLIVRLTNINLTNNNKQLLTTGELLKFFGVVLLMTKYEFTARASLWSRTPLEKYEQAPNFGKTGLSRDRFDILFRNIRFSEQPNQRPEEWNSEKYRWTLVDDFITNYNQHRASNFTPSEMLCVDESMIRWYGTGGSWINAGLPNNVAIDRKPENGCEVQNCACGATGVMLQLRLVKTVEEENANLVEEDGGLLHGIVVLKDLVRPWFLHTGLFALTHTILLLLALKNYFVIKQD